jgi:hypothetical protein
MQKINAEKKHQEHVVQHIDEENAGKELAGRRIPHNACLHVLVVDGLVRSH